MSAENPTPSELVGFALRMVVERMAFRIDAMNERGLDAPPLKKPRMRYCFNCGAELGQYADYDPLDTCGSRECDRAAQEIAQQQRDEAHGQLDRDMGWL